jgi:hypothetical protein
LQLESLVANYLQLKGSFLYILFLFLQIIWFNRQVNN